jgi:hypothetical protein
MKLYMFGTVPLSIINQFFTVHAAIGGICHTSLLTACKQDQDGSILILLTSCQQTIIYTIAVCIVKNS